MHVYRLLLWIDPTIGLAHCYESDKAQPGRPWYERSARFHRWVSQAFNVAPTELADQIDFLFRSVVSQLQSVQRQRAIAFTPHPDLPKPGTNPEVESVVENFLRSQLVGDAARLSREIVSAVSTTLASENKRKNLVGEGFEDTLATLLRLHPLVRGKYSVMLRPPLHDIGGFNAPRKNDKTKRVDLALVRLSDGHRILVSCKWSVRSDREEQFATDFEAYSALENRGESFDYVLITNEFDPARLSAACDNRRGNSLIFDHVVHVSTEALSQTYGAATRSAGGMARVFEHMSSGRLQSLDHWISRL